MDAVCNDIFLWSKQWMLRADLFHQLTIYLGIHVPPENDKEMNNKWFNIIYILLILYRNILKTQFNVNNKMLLTIVASVHGTAFWTFPFMLSNVSVWIVFKIAIDVSAFISCIVAFLIRNRKITELALKVIKIEPIINHYYLFSILLIERCASLIEML